MPPNRRRKLDQTVASLRLKYGDRVVLPASEMFLQDLPPHIPSGFPGLDHLTGCGGIPLDALTLLSGHTTSGKLTLAYKVLAIAQYTRPAPVALLDLTRSSDPDYLARCGIDLQRLLLVRPRTGQQAVEALLDTVHSRQVQTVLVDSLPDLAQDRGGVRTFNRNLAGLQRLLHRSGCAVLLLDEPQPPWLRWLGLHRSFGVEQWASLHISLRREQWLYEEEELRGYRAKATISKCRWARRGDSTPIEFRFNGTVQSARTF